MTGAIRRLVKRVAIGGLVGAGMIVAVPGAAHAALGGCSTDVIGNNKGTAYCSLVNNDSHFRAKVTCYKITTGQISRTIYGPWRYSAAQSAATCPTGEALDNVVVDKVN